MDVLNKAFPYVTRFAAWVLTFLSFLSFCVFVAEFSDHFYLDPVLIINTLCNVIIIVITHLTATIKYATGSTPYIIPLNAYIMEKHFSKLHRFKLLDKWSTKTNVLGLEIWIFLYLRIIRKTFVLPDYGKGYVTQRQQTLIKKIEVTLSNDMLCHNLIIHYLLN